MKERPAPHDGPHGGGCAGGRAAAVSTATVEDLAAVARDLAEAERLRGRAVTALARVRARGDGEAACGMPVTQHLRWTTNLRRGAISTMAVVTDVAAELPTLLGALEAGAVTLDQVAAVAWPAARVSADLRRSLDLSLAEGVDWTRLAPEALESEVGRLLEALADPVQVARRERKRRQRRFLHLQPELDGQAVAFWGRAVGLDAALLETSLREAAAAPVADYDPDPDGVVVRDRARGRQLHDGLLRILREWGSRDRSQPTGPDLTLYAIVDERADAPSAAAELLTSVRGLAPRLSPDQVARLTHEGRTNRVTIRADRHGDLVTIDGRAGHLHDDPMALSEDTTRTLCLARDATCRAPGCDRPALHADLHHLRWRSWGTADQPVRDDPTNRALVCRRCHHRVVHRWRWTATVHRAGRVSWHRVGPEGDNLAGRHVRHDGAGSAKSTATRARPTTVGRFGRRLPKQAERRRTP